MPNVTEALRDIADGSTILISGFGGAGLPIFLLDALLEQSAHGALQVAEVETKTGDKATLRADLASIMRKKAGKSPAQVPPEVPPGFTSEF